MRNILINESRGYNTQVLYQRCLNTLYNCETADQYKVALRYIKQALTVCHKSSDLLPHDIEYISYIGDLYRTYVNVDFVIMKNYRKQRLTDITVVDAYYWCINHPKIGRPECQGNIELTPHMVNAESGIIETNQDLNNKLEWWIEYAKLDYGSVHGMQTHFYKLDCGADTPSEAVLKLKELILDQYGDY